jgi:acetyl-CoA acetyltransferase family protein
MKQRELRDDEPVIVDAVRSAVGRYGGALREWHAAALLGRVLAELLRRNGLPPETVDDVIAGCATQVGEQAGNVARTALLLADFPVGVPGMTVQRACGSSQQAVHVADNLIRAGTADVVIAAGIEHMSRTRGGNDDDRYGKRYPDALVRHFSLPGMGEAAERIAERWRLARTWLDELALRSHALAAAAEDAGYLAPRILPLESVDNRLLTCDEGIRRDSSLAKLANLSSVFRMQGHITAGNSSQVSDGAAALLLMRAGFARHHGLRPLARIRAQCVVGVDPEIMLNGPIPATRRILARAGLSLRDIDLFEVNEAFASVVGAWLQETRTPLVRVNVNGGAIAMGHPLGATGARLMMILMDELHRRGNRLGLLTMCCGGGLGIATLIETVEDA